MNVQVFIFAGEIFMIYLCWYSTEVVLSKTLTDELNWAAFIFVWMRGVICYWIAACLLMEIFVVMDIFIDRLAGIPD